MIKAVLFDYSGVFTSFPFLSLEPDLLKLFWGDYGDVEANHAWHRLERGEISLGEFWSDLTERCRAERGDDFDPQLFINSLRDGFAVHFVLVHRARQLKERYTLALLTNNVREFGDGWRQTIPVDELFDVVVDSCEVGARKPEPRYFRLALERIGIEPEEAVFLDDMESNVAGARAVGIRGIHVTSPDQAIAELERALRDE